MNLARGAVPASEEAQTYRVWALGLEFRTGTFVYEATTRFKPPNPFGWGESGQYKSGKRHGRLVVETRSRLTMDIAVFGATGGTGKQFVGQATETGHNIRALTRSPEKLSSQGTIESIEGNVLDPETVAQTVRGGDAVVCLLGRTRNNPGNVVSRGTENILRAMMEQDVGRLVVVTSIGLGSSRRNLQWYGRIANATVLHGLMEDKARQEELVMGSRADWTIVRPGGLTDGPQTGGYVHGVGVDESAAPISRADVADFLLKVLERSLYIRETPIVTTREGVSVRFLWEQVTDVTNRLLRGK